MKLDAGPESVWEKKQNDFKNKRNKFNQRGPRHSRLIQLAFHDCLRYLTNVFLDDY